MLFKTEQEAIEYCVDVNMKEISSEIQLKGTGNVQSMWKI